MFTTALKVDCSILLQKAGRDDRDDDDGGEDVDLSAVWTRLM